MENYPSPAAFKLPFSPKGWEEGGSLETLRRSEIQIKKHTKTSSQGYRMYPPFTTLPLIHYILSWVLPGISPPDIDLTT